MAGKEPSTAPVVPSSRMMPVAPKLATSSSPAGVNARASGSDNPPVPLAANTPRLAPVRPSNRRMPRLRLATYRLPSGP